jgi:DNA-binding PadR family transcriptional regulator
MQPERHEKLPATDIEIVGNDRYHPALNQREQLLESMGLYSHRAINGWLVLTENLEMTLLKQLLKMQKANVYEISRSRNLGHYSTVLRGLRRLEDKKLVQSIHETSQGRHEKIYQVAIVGELFVFLAKTGWKGTSDRIASESSKFRDCIATHELHDPFYYWHLTQNILEKLSQRAKRKQEPKLEEIVAEAEFNWIKSNVIERLSDRQYLVEGLTLLERLADVAWIKPVIVQQITQYSEEWNRWLNAIDGLRAKITN